MRPEATASTTLHTSYWLDQPFPKTHRKPTPEELEILNKFIARRGPTAPIKLELDTSAEDEGNCPKFKFNLDDERIGLILLMEAVGTTDRDFLDGLIFFLTQANTVDGEFCKLGLDFMLSVIKGLKPRDQVEAMLGAQMATVHIAAMRAARRLASAINVHELETAERIFIKLTRTFVSQMEALRRYRMDRAHTAVANDRRAIIANTHSENEGRSEVIGSGSAPAKANGHANGFSPRVRNGSALRRSKSSIAHKAGRNH